jgi:hypothetical protein
MDQDRKYVISKTLIGETLYYIARNKGGNVFAREVSLEKLHIAIQTYKEPPIPKAELPVESVPESESAADTDAPKPKKKFLINELSEKVQQARKKQEEAPAPPINKPAVTESKQVKNELQEKVQEKRAHSKKESFWDKLK